MQDATVLDDQLVNELRDIMGAEFPVLVHAWLRDAEARLSELHTLMNGPVAPDHAAIRRAAHSLKGSSSNLGAVRVSRLCAQLEASAEKHEAVSAERLSALVEAVEEASAGLRARLQAAPPPAQG